MTDIDKKNEREERVCELADLMNNLPMCVLNLNIGEMTQWYDALFIEDVLRRLRFKRDVDMLTNLVILRWQHDVDERDERVSRFNPDRRLWEPLDPQFPQTMRAARQRVMEYLTNKEKLAAFEDNWRAVYANARTDVDFRLDDLEPNVRAVLLIDDDWRYSELVRVMRGPVSQWIAQHNLHDWGVVRFVCRLRGIVRRDSSIADFNRLLMAVGMDNQKHNIRFRKDCNTDANLDLYDRSTPTRPIPAIAKLKKDAQELERLFFH